MMILVLRQAKDGNTMHLTHDRRYFITCCLAEGLIDEPVREEFGERLSITPLGLVALEMMERGEWEEVRRLGISILDDG